MFKLCRDYHACRAEFGRVGGVAKYISKVDLMTPNIAPSVNKKVMTCAYLKEYTRLIDILCLSCKESANRLRLKEQGYLINMLKLQQKLKNNKNELNKYFKTDAESSEDNSFIDATLYNKLLVALCCFAHDQDSMNILLNNGLIESLLGYLTEANKIENLSNRILTENENDLNLESLFEIDAKSISLKKLLAPNAEDSNNLSKISKSGSKKRKTTDSLETSKPKRTNSDLCNQVLSSPPLVPSMFQPITETYNFDTQATSPTESYLSLSPSVYISSPPQIQIPSRCSSAQIFQGLSPNFYSSLSPSTSMNEIAPSPSYLNFPVNEEQELEYMDQIKFSPSINNESSAEDESMDEIDVAEETDKKGDESGQEQEQDLNENLNTCQSIESINHTEACVFYVLSQLSHGDKPSLHLINNFEQIILCILSYLKIAKVRNPRALRILNRLTKNQYCFYYFIQTQFPYKLKSIFYEQNTIDDLTGLKFKKKIMSKNFTKSKSFANLFKLSNEDEESDDKKANNIEKEMNVYLNSNKAFFDAKSFFPSFESIEFTLINNLKMQCISSSDAGYSCLISMMKQRKLDKLSSALVSPFILRNSKALYYIMIQLNGIDMILASVFTNEFDEGVKFKSILCINRILSFISYKRDLKQVKDYYDSAKLRVNESLGVNEELLKGDEIHFVWNSDGQIKELKANKSLLAKKSEYFNALLNGHFSNVDLIELKEVSFETFVIIMDMLKCSDENLIECKIGFDLCVDLIMACDRFILNDLKEFFISVLISKFMSLSTLVSCFKLSWYLNCSFLSNASIDFLLSEFQVHSSHVDLNSQNESLKYFFHVFNFLLDNLRLSVDKTNERLTEQAQVSFTLTDTASQVNNNEKLLVESFRKVFKHALSEIIKNNYWKF